MAETRILRIKLREAIKTALRTDTRASLAMSIGISRPKLNAIIREQWDYITRDAIERVADYFQLDVRDVFEFCPIPFWKPLEAVGACTFLRGSHGVAPAGDRDMRIPYFDSRATGVIQRWLRHSTPPVSDTPYADYLRKESDIIGRAMRENCIVIGSPQTNAATEVLLSRFFDAEPFQPSTPNRRRIPFGFCWPQDNEITRQSSLACSDLARQQLSTPAGIALSGGYQFRADFRPPSEFKEWQTRKGLDCGIVFVANKPFGTSQDVKLIVVAGVHGIGTLAAASALVQDFRYLEPEPQERYVLGIVEGHYSKQSGSLERRYTGFRWKYRYGGASPLLSSRSTEE